MEYGVWSMEYGVDAAMWSVITRRAEESGDEDGEARRGDARHQKKRWRDNKLGRHKTRLTN